jgi:hypothetical protein
LLLGAFESFRRALVTEPVATVLAPPRYSHQTEAKECRFEFPAELPNATLARVAARNTLDAALYRAAKSRLLDDAARLFGTLERARACSRYDCAITPAKGATCASMSCTAAFDLEKCARRLP